MKRIIRHIAFIAIAAGIVAGCSPDSYVMGEMDVKPEDLVEGIAFKIEHDAQNPNIIHLTSLMDAKYLPLWKHPQGSSQKPQVTLNIAFPGTYEVTFGVETRGGVVYGAPATFTIDDFYAEFVNDPLWTMISGGVGEEKTWYLDLDADALSRYFAGPLYFYGTADTWDQVTNGIAAPEGSDSWNWCPDYAGNSWMFNAADFGTMTFNLKDGANVIVEHLTLPARGTETGTYMLDVENHTLRLSGASPLHDTNRDGVVIDWGDIRIMSLTENTMQLGVLRDAALSGEGACLLVYNYISKEYRDNWTPGNPTEPDPPYTGDGNTDLTTSQTKTWVLSVETPYNWTSLDGTFLNNVTSPADYVASGWMPYDESLISNISLTMSRTGSMAGDYVFTDGSGNEIEGSYTIDTKNNITFDQDISFSVSDWVMLETTAEKQLRIISSETDALGGVTGIWLGKRDPTKDEYLVYHFVLGTAAPGDPDKAVKQMLCAHTWKIDVAGTKFGGPLSYADPSTFPTLTNEWTPDLASNSWVMIDGDHGSMKFNSDGTVHVSQNRVTSGAFSGTDELDGTWTYSGSTLKLTMSIGILHADNFTYAVADWGDARLQSIGADFLRLCVVRDPVLSGESEYLYIFNYIPAAKKRR